MSANADGEAEYLKKIRRLVEQGAIKPGKVQHVDVYHDDWCAVFKGKPCNCEPVVKVRK